MQFCIFSALYATVYCKFAAELSYLSMSKGILHENKSLRRKQEEVGRKQENSRLQMRPSSLR